MNESPRYEMEGNMNESPRYEMEGNMNESSRYEMEGNMNESSRYEMEGNECTEIDDLYDNEMEGGKSDDILWNKVDLD
jgi:hypothetical protein